MQTSDDLLREIVKASNRTTRAVRAFVRFFFIQLTSIGVAFLLFQGGQATSSSFWMLIASAVWLVGLVVSLREGWRELRLSDPLDNATLPTKRGKSRDECRYCDYEMKAGEKSCGSCGRMQFGL